MSDKLKVPKAMQPVYAAVAGNIDEFCQKHLNEEYSLVSRELAAALCRKRPSPFLKGKPEQWACVYVIGIGKSTATAKARSIEKLMGISYLDPRWTLPSRMENNPLVWMLNVNGFAVDTRTAPLELQEEAFQRGLIPYVPGKKG